MNTLTHILAVVCVSAFVLPVASVQQEMDEQAPLLEGPKIEHDGHSLVRFDRRGNLLRVEGRPEMSAVSLLAMEPERRDDLRLINEARRTEVAMLLAENIDMLRESTDASRAGDQDTAQRIMQELFRMLQPEPARDPLLERYAEVLTEEELAETQRILDEYWSVWIERTRRGQDMMAGAEAEQQIEQRLSFQLFQEEIAEAYQWSLRPYQQKIERIAEIVSTTPEQREAIRFVIIDHIREARLEPTEELQQRTAKRIYDILDETQREKLFEYVWWRLQ